MGGQGRGGDVRKQWGVSAATARVVRDRWKLKSVVHVARRAFHSSEAPGMSHVTFTEPGELGITFQSGELAEVLAVTPGSASARAGVQEGWLIERVNDRPMHRRTFKDVTAALKDPSRPLRIQFAVQSVHIDHRGTLGGGWLFDVPVSLPDGLVVFVSVAQQDNVETTGDLKRLLLEQQCAHLPAHAVQLMLVRQLFDSGLRGATRTGEKEELVRDNKTISSLRARLDGRIESLRVRVEPPHIWSAKLAGCCEHSIQPNLHARKTAEHLVDSEATSADDMFELQFEDD